LPVIRENYQKLTKSGKRATLSLVLRLDSVDGDRMYMDIIRQYARQKDGVPSLGASILQAEPRRPAIFMPVLLDYADVTNLSSDIYLLALAYLEHQMIDPAQIAGYTEKVRSSWKAQYKKILAVQEKHKDDPAPRSKTWIYDDDDYSPLRYDAGVTLDLMGYLPRDQMQGELNDALDQIHDQRLRLFAAISLLRLGGPHDPPAVRDIAANAETRNWLFDHLQQLGRSELFPAEFATQRYLAEGEMVEWLCYPTELGRPPDEIELMKVISVDGGRDGVIDTYLYRFRTFEPHWAAKDGWMAGVAGPFRRRDEPTFRSLGGTFSSFAKWDSKTPEKHVRDVEKQISDAWQLRAKQDEPKADK
jgi:hypothetical protein